MTKHGEYVVFFCEIREFSYLLDVDFERRNAFRLGDTSERTFCMQVRR